MRTVSTLAWLGGISTLAAGAMGQSINIRFGSSAAPSPTYGAAGLSGTWNSFVVTPGYANQPLVSLQNTPIAAQYYQYGNSSMLAYNNPLTAGDDERLMDSMILSTNSPTDGCFWVQGLMLGPYEVTIYANTPNDPTYMVRTRVDSGTPGPLVVGGTWPGHHQAGVTYARFNVTTTDGVIGFHDGLAGGNIQSGMNGVQLRFLGPCSPPVISSQPSSVTRCSMGSAPFSVTATGGGTLAYQWQLETSAGVWATMGNDPMPLGCSPGAFAYATPINSASVTIGIRPCPGVTSYRVRCVVGNACGTATSSNAIYTICAADADCNGQVQPADVATFINTWFGSLSGGGLAGDFDGNGVVNPADVAGFVNAWFGALSSGC